jgi:ADP-heptose:LPS heptosyltransferase
LFSNVKNNKEEMVKIPRPSEEKMASAKKYLRENSVGIFARGRITYGRNLNDDFYIKLIKHLLSNGYNPIWLGEKQSVKPCPIEGIIDFSRMPESKDLELTLAIISQLKFTIQFWTASTRLASMMDVPWILFESPDQIYGDIGQEGKRIYLSTEESKKKIVLAQYHDVVEDYDSAIMFLDQAIKEIKEENWEDIIGPCKYPDVVRAMMKRKEEWI